MTYLDISTALHQSCHVATSHVFHRLLIHVENNAKIWQKFVSLERVRIPNAFPQNSRGRGMPVLV